MADGHCSQGRLFLDSWRPLNACCPASARSHRWSCFVASAFVKPPVVSARYQVKREVLDVGSAALAGYSLSVFLSLAPPAGP